MFFLYTYIFKAARRENYLEGGLKNRKKERKKERKTSQYSLNLIFPKKVLFRKPPQETQSAKYAQITKKLELQIETRKLQNINEAINIFMLYNFTKLFF